MRVLHLNTTDNEGGAARALYRLHSGLKKIGLDSKILAKFNVTNDPDVAVVYKNRLHYLMDRVFYPAFERIGLQDIFYPSVLDLLRHNWIRNADVIQLHNLHGRYFPFPFLRFFKQKKIIWYLHDMWAFTGHCIYSYNCEKYKQGCFDCPIWREDYLPLKYDTTSLHHKIKVSSYKSLDLHVVAPSKWMQKAAQESVPFRGFSVHHIPYGIDSDLFIPVDKLQAKLMLGLKSKRIYILFGAHVLDKNPRKGAKYFIEALGKLSPENKKEITVLIIGENYSSEIILPDIEYKYLGYITNDLFLPILLSAADLFVMPSLADNLPLTIMECMACETPIVAFDIGGIPDLVEHMNTGYLSRYRDVDDLSAGIRILVDNPKLRRKLGLAARELVKKKFSIPNQTERFNELYESIA
ncbi:MAG: glycosyltransferase family 4 protein [Promethearchaeota archaeon]|jgi:glycosyltransferase involved in cell wall biosynthesis